MWTEEEAPIDRIRTTSAYKYAEAYALPATESFVDEKGENALRHRSLIQNGDCAIVTQCHQQDSDGSEGHHGQRVQMTLARR